MAAVTETKKPMRESLARAENGEFRLTEDLGSYLRAYAREKPDVCALWCFGIGFVLGWKLKPW
jgi:hypothetical protein